ncbi:MAG: diguanylate cyclase [Lachnospiraceae bacterium]|nr:diguanylate cyclase [Lachnospiraceae bacterium]
MKSIQTKIIIIIISILAIFGTSAFIIAYNNTKTVLDEEMKTFLNLTGDKEKKEIDELLNSVEQSVNTIYNYAYQELDKNPELLIHPKEKDLYRDDIESISDNIAKNTEGALSIYFRFNPDDYGGVDGFWYCYNYETNTWYNHEITDMSKYDKDDVERVGWYYIPVNHGHPVWMNTYYNQNLEKEMFSYVVPFIRDDYTVGVVGMDIDVGLIRDSVSKISLYENGEAFLLQENGDVVYHKDYPEGCAFSELKEYEQENVKIILENEYDKVITYQRSDNIQRRAVLKKLKNGMVMGIYVPLSEVNKPQNQLLERYLIFMLIMLLAACIVCVIWIRTVIKPLKKLTNVVKKYKEGKLDTEIDIYSKDEVGVLADSFRQTAKSLNEYIKVVNDQAKTDTLTGLNNNSAYSEMEDAINRQIKEGDISFTVVVLDINNLKKVNDKYGHKDGDELIITVAHAIEEAFGKRAAFRIGGDEFVALLRNAEKSFVDECINKTRELINDHNKKYSPDDWRSNISVAIGMSEYRKDVDNSYIDVFNAADEKMYENKKEIKEIMNSDVL